MKKVILLFCMLVSLTLYSSDTHAQVFGLGFNKNAPVWWPLENADFNAGFKHAYLDIEAFVNSAAIEGIAFGHDEEGNSIILNGIFIDDDALPYVDQMINYYYNQALNPAYGNADYRRGIEEAASTWGSIKLAIIFST